MNYNDPYIRRRRCSIRKKMIFFILSAVLLLLLLLLPGLYNNNIIMIPMISSSSRGGSSSSRTRYINSMDSRMNTNNIDKAAVVVALPVIDYSKFCLTDTCLKTEGHRLARAFTDKPFDSWCVFSKNKTSRRHHRDEESWQGLLLVRPYKTASSTLAGIALRISHRHHRIINNNKTATTTSTTNCDVQWGHARGQISNYLYKRNTSKSLLIAPIRRAAARAYSASFFFEPSKSGYKSDATLLHDFYLQYQQWPGGLIYNFLWGTGRSKSNFTQIMLMQQQSDGHGPSRIHDSIHALIHNYYDFFIVVERFDESIVALALLTGLDVSDVLVQSSKIAGDATAIASSTSASPEQLAVTRYTRKNGQCMLHRQQKMSIGIRNYTTTSQEWLYWNYADEVLWHAVNASLDRTINYLGRSRFQTALQQYYMYKKKVESACPEPQGCIPGMPPDQIQELGCYSQDFGCGYPCVDQVIRQIQQQQQQEKQEPARD